MRRFYRPAALVAGTLAIAWIAVPAQPIAAAAPATATVRLTLTGLNRDSQVVAVPQAELLGLRNGAEYTYQGSPLAVLRGTYLIVADVPAYSGTVQTSDTLVFAKETVGRAETIRLDGRGGRKLNVSLTGVSATSDVLLASVCMSRYPGSGGDLVGGASGGPGVAVYAVPVRSRYVTFEYGDILTSAVGATYYLTGSAATGKIPARLDYVQRASGLAKLTMALRSGAYGSSEFNWDIQAGDGQSFCSGVGQNTDTFSVQSWVNYLTPGVWTTSAVAYSEDAHGNFDKNASFFITGRYRAGGSYTNTFGAAVAGPGPSFPQTSIPDQGARKGTMVSYAPDLYASPGTSGDQVCCDISQVSLRLGSRVIRTEHVGTQGFFTAVIHQSGWYTLNVTDRRSFPGGGLPTGLLSPRVAVSFRFHAPAHPAGNGASQDVPVTDARYDPLGLNSANQAPADGMTVLDVTIARPGNDGVPTPVYRLKAVKIYASFNDGASWQLLTARRHGRAWQVTITDPSSGYVAIRSIVTDVRGDSTEQTVYRAYGITGP
jgi:hypothetical protein